MAAQDARPFIWHYPDLNDKNFELHGRGHYPDLDDKNFDLHGRGLLIRLLVFLSFTLLCLYFLWFCSFRAQWGSSPGPDGPSREGSGKNGLDQNDIGSLPVLLHRRAADEGGREARDEEDSMCSICLSAFAEEEKVKMLPKCGHTFHPECVDEWLKTQPSCPLCRSCIVILA